MGKAMTTTDRLTLALMLIDTANAADRKAEAFVRPQRPWNSLG